MQAIRTWPDFVPAEQFTLGWDAVMWTMQYLVQPDGPNAGDPFVYTDEQLRILLRWYEIDVQGRFVHRRGVLRRMKGWGKDPFLASIAAVELCGPCRFGGWDNRGKPIAVQHPAAWIQVAAVSKDQTRNTMTLFPGMFNQAAIDEYRIDIGKEIIYARNGCRIEAVTSSPRALEGGRPSLVIMNETHHWLHTNDGHAMADGIRRNLGKSRDGSARSMEITNAHLPGEDSVAERTHEAWRKANGNLPGVYYDSVEAPPVENLGDVEAVREALLAARQDSVWLDVDRLAEEIADPVTDAGMSRRFYFNQVTRQGGTWLPSGAWDACAREGARIPEHARAVLALDGSFNGDSTALVAVSVEPVGVAPTIEVAGCWEAPPEKPDWRVPISDVEEAIRAACKKWQILEVVADPYRWSRSLEELEAEGLPMLEYPQSPQRMTPATARLYEAVVNNLVWHNGDDRLARHISNAVLKVDSRGSRLTKETKNSPRKIDLAVTTVMAYDRALALQTEEAPACCETCGKPLDDKGKCPECSPQVYSIREVVEELRKERRPDGNRLLPTVSVSEYVPPTEIHVPEVVFHKF